MLIVCFLMAPLAALAARLDVSDFAKSGTLQLPSISPDGQYLALSLHNNNAKWDESAYQLVVFHLPDLTGVSRLNMAQFYQPAQIVWVSDKRLVVTLAYNSGSLDVPQLTGDIVALDYDGNHKQTVYSLNHRGSINAGRYSKDMPRGSVTIAGLPSPRNGHIYLNVAIYPQQRTGYLAAKESQVYDVDARTGKPTLVGDIDKGDMSFVVHDGVARFAYGSDDAHIVNVYTRAGADKPWLKLGANITGKEFVPLRISRDGYRLWSLSSPSGGPAQLIESTLDGSNRKVLASDPSASVENVLWDSTTGTPYAAEFMVGRPRFVYLDNSLQARILKALNAKFPDHLVTIAGTDDPGTRMLIEADSDRDPGSVALFDAEKMSLRPLYQVAGWIHADQMAKREPFRFKASDGMELDGYLTLPPGVPPKNLPAVLVPHGGPIGIRDRWRYDADSQFLANRGYAVVQVNYRGSSGRGPDFELAGYKHFGDRIQKDLHEGLQWAIDQGYVDPRRIAVYGGSFGGYSSLMQPILFPETYRCAVDYAGVSDWSIGMEMSDTAKFKAGRTYFAEAIGDKAAAKAISPLYHLDKFNVPVLIAHGEDDPRVPYKNATELRAALQNAGKPFEWLSRPKEGHGFYTEKDRADLYTKMDVFLGKCLGS